MPHGRHRADPVVRAARLRRLLVVAVVVLLASVGIGVGLQERLAGHRKPPPPTGASSRLPFQAESPPSSAAAPIPTVSAPPSPAPAQGGVYAGATGTTLSPVVSGIPERVYVPDTQSGTVEVIDPQTYRVLNILRVGGVPHHVTPSWDLKHLYVDNPGSGTLEVIDPRTQRVTGEIRVPSPYNLYFTPDGTKAIDVAEYDRELQFRDPKTWQLIRSVPIPWPGVDHMDFSPDGSYLLVSCEYSGVVVRVSTRKMSVTGTIQVGGRPVDVKVSPDGRVFYVANQGLGGVSVIDPGTMRQIAFLRTGTGAHGFAVSRNARYLYLSNRLAGTISVISFRTRRVIATWSVGDSPDMLQVSTDGKHLWASNRFGNTVSVISTVTGRVIHTITVGSQPHGLAYFPQPGRYSIGHNGVYR